MLAVPSRRTVFPPRPFGRALLLRAALLWVGVRAVLLFLRPSREVAFPSLRAAVLIVAVVGGLGLFEARRRNDIVLLANLGFGRATIVALSAAPASLLELLVASVASALGL